MLEIGLLLRRKLEKSSASGASLLTSLKTVPLINSKT